MAGPTATARERRIGPEIRGLVSSALDLPRAVGLAAGCAIGLMLLAADHDRLRIFTAILAGGELVRLGRRDRAGVACIGIVPHRGLARLILLKRLRGRLLGHLLVPIVQLVTDKAAEQRTAQGGGNDHTGAAACGRSDAGAGACT